MKKPLILLAIGALSILLSSCCSMFGRPSFFSGYRTETHQVATGKYETVYEEVHTGGKGGMVQTVEKKVPIYKTVTRRVLVPCQRGTRYYCPKKDCNGTTSEAFTKMASTQGSTGSPHIGLVPTMRKLAQ